MSYNIEHCTNGIPDQDPRGIKPDYNPDSGENPNEGSGTKYAAFSVAGVVLVALLGFASHRFDSENIVYLRLMKVFFMLYINFS